MSETVVVAVISVVGIVLGALIARLYADVAGLRAENRRLWIWARSLVDYAYRHRHPTAPPLPDPPAFDDD